MRECEQVLEGLGLTSDQFIDMCILCGCDYCGTLKGVRLLVFLYERGACTSSRGFWKRLACTSSGRRRICLYCSQHWSKQHNSTRCPCFVIPLGFRVLCKNREALICVRTPGVAAKSALQLVQKHGSLEAVLEAVSSKHPPPEDYPYKEARALFQSAWLFF